MSIASRAGTFGHHRSVNVNDRWAPPWASGLDVTYRQLDYWTRRGWLHPIGTGSGNRRIWPEPERRCARIMARCVAAGLTPETAARVARHVLETGHDEPVLVDLADDIGLLIA